MKLLLFLSLFIGGLIWAFISSQKSLPGDIIYFLKGFTEEIQLATTEIDGVKRADVYIFFTNKRLDELEELEKRKVSSSLAIKVMESAWESEKKVIKLLDEGAKLNSISEQIKKLKELRIKQEVILDKILEETPAPDFYTILDIKEKSLEAIDNFTSQNH